jgi:hypothetical protein
MRVALLISGHARTFVFQEQRRFFKHFLKSLKKQASVDVYIMLKIDDRLKTYQGIKNLKKIIKTLNPVYSIAFEKWSENNDVYYSQIKMIQHLCIKATKQYANKDYDFYIRIRPDLVLNSTIDLKRLQLLTTFTPRIYTSYKFDSIGNDQFIIIPKKCIHWLLELPMHPTLYEKLPDYVIFNHIRPFVSQIVGSGIVREYKKIQTWNIKHDELNPQNYWREKQDFIPNENYLEELKKIIPFMKEI